MATDIAFALGALVLLGKRVPKNLLTFLIALAIVDDLDAVLVIALFYTETINTLALTIPMRPKYNPSRFLSHINEIIKHIKRTYKQDENIVTNDELRSRVRALGDGVLLVQAPAQIMERKMHIPTAYFIIPIFSLANTGIPIDWASIGSVVTHPVSIGITAGLVVGKLIGIAGFSWLTVKLGVTSLPHGLNFKHIIGAALMGGIGFTMSIFIAELGFAHSAEDLLMAKTGILMASAFAGISGFIWLFLTAEKTEKLSQESPTR